MTLELTDQDPSVADALWRQGLAHQALANQAAARRCFQKALTLDPEHELSKQALSALK